MNVFVFYVTFEVLQRSKVLFPVVTLTFAGVVGLALKHVVCAILLSFFSYVHKYVPVSVRLTYVLVLDCKLKVLHTATSYYHDMEFEKTLSSLDIGHCAT